MKRCSARAGRARLRADHRRRREHVVQRHRLEPHVGVPLEPAASPRPRSPPNTRRPYSGALRRLYAWLGRPRARGRDPRRLLRLGAARESTTTSFSRAALVARPRPGWSAPRKQVAATGVEALPRGFHSGRIPSRRRIGPGRDEGRPPPRVTWCASPKAPSRLTPVTHAKPPPKEAGR